MPDKDFSLGLGSGIEKLELINKKLNELCVISNDLEKLGFKLKIKINKNSKFFKDSLF